MERSVHIPVLASEVIAWLQPAPGMTILDGTLGGGGHTRLLAERVVPGGTVLACDRDPEAIRLAEQSLAGQAVKLAQGNFGDLPQLLERMEVCALDGAVLDLGLSSDQLADGTRGFSFDADGPLDLRFDPESGRPAWRLLERLSERELADLIYQYGEERFSRRIARRVVQQRRHGSLRTARQLADLVRGCVPRARHHRIDPATRTFQALRIAVNDELGALERFLDSLPSYLNPGGRVAIISFHSLEDRIVKQAFRDDSRYMILTKKPIRPIEAEVRSNLRSRSARMRVAECADR